MLRDYLTKLAILSQYSGSTNALIIPDNGVPNGENGATVPQTGDQDKRRQSTLSEEFLLGDDGPEIFVPTGALVPNMHRGCHVNPFYRGNPGDDR